jgi:ribosomal protein L24
MANVPTGTLFALATAFGSTKTITVVTNASPAVCTSTAHGFSNGDQVRITSGWGRLNGRVFEVANITANTFEIDIDTTDTDVYPAGSGTGSCVEITTWVQMSKVMNPQTSGGDAKQVTYKFVDSDVDYSINDGFNATSYSFDLDDDDSTVGYAAAKSLTEVQTDTVLRMTMRNGAKVYIPGRVALNDVPVLQEGQINRIRLAFNGNARHSRVAA